ncbi:MAG: DUF433 domain-containing protein [Bacteroidota bacterium]
MDPNRLINSDPEILSGIQVFAGTRVPIQTLFDHLERGISLTEFLDDFPSVSKDQAVGILEVAGKMLTSKNLKKLYEAAA